MPAVLDLLPRRQQLALAVRAKGPTEIAQTLAIHAGQFYDREPFDVVAREVYALYAADSADAADRFRHRLDRRLRERDHRAVSWDPRTVGSP